MMLKGEIHAAGWCGRQGTSAADNAFQGFWVSWVVRMRLSATETHRRGLSEQNGWRSIPRAATCA